MKFIIAIVIAAGIAIGLGMFAMEDPGYVQLSREPYNVRMSISVLIGLVLIVFLVLYLLVNFIVGLIRTPKRIRRWRLGKKRQGAQETTMKGFANLIEGDWSEAEEKLLSSLEHNQTSLMNYLGAAYAAQQQGETERRDRHMEAALKAFPGQELAIRLTRARMEMQNGNWIEARTELEAVRLDTPGNVAAARLLADTYSRLEDWSSLIRLLPVLQKLKAFPEEDLRIRKTHALKGYLEAPQLLQGDVSDLDAAYRTLPKRTREDAAALAGYARQLIRKGEHRRAEPMLRRALNRKWNGELIRLYGQLETANARDQINILNRWGKGHEDHPDLQWALATLYWKENDLEQARDLLAQVASSTGDMEALAALGELLEQAGESDAAMKIYRKGMRAHSSGSTGQADSRQSTAVLGSSSEEEKSRDIIPVASDR